MKATGQTELLAPAGGVEAGLAALQYGADAVYCGLSRFSARADAENFSQEALRELVGYAHSLDPRRRVYAAVNTLVLDREREEGVRLLFDLADGGVDALIVQDIGVAALARRHVPELRLHASTQLAVHSLEGARALGRLGFRRVILARELSVAEICRIAAHAGVDVEVFIHGALCYSYSGLCLFSSHVVGRSGNRGRCAQCCRDLFTAEGCAGAHAVERPFLPFSMKDLAWGPYLNRLREGGVAALKIEGRMKSPLYVAAVVDYYRRLLDGRLEASERARLEEDLQTVFSRPWTSLYADGASREPVVDPVNTGHRGARIGTVEAVRCDPRNGSRWLVFRTARALQRHDGLQVDLPGEARPVGFPVDAMRAAPGGRSAAPASRDAVSVAAGAAVEVRLPDDVRDLPRGAPVYCASSQAVKQSYPIERPRPGAFRQRRPIRVTIDIAADRVQALAETAEAPGARVEVAAPGPFDAARQTGQTVAAFRQAFDRTGDTEWSVAALDVHDPDGRFVPVSRIQELRRELCRQLSSRWAASREAHLAGVWRDMEAVVAGGPADDGACGWSARARAVGVLRAIEADEPGAMTEAVWRLEAGMTDAVLAAGLEALGGLRRRDALRLGLPALVRDHEAEAIRRLLATALAAGAAKIEIGNVNGLQWLAEAAGTDWARTLDVTADWTLYATNRHAAREWLACGLRRVLLSPEDERANLMSLLGVLGGVAGVLLYQHTPLFVSATPPARGRQGGGAWDDGALLAGRQGRRLRVWRDGACYVTVDERPFCIAAERPMLERAGCRHFRVDLSYAGDTATALQAWRTVRAGQCPPDSHAGNYLRGWGQNRMAPRRIGG